MKIESLNIDVEPRYKSDEDIEKEFIGFSLEELKLERRDVSDIYNQKVVNKDQYFEGMAVWSFPNAGESVGGGSDTVVEYFPYNIDNGTFTYVVENWYPDNIYFKMINILKSKLLEAYGRSFTQVERKNF